MSSPGVSWLYGRKSGPQSGSDGRPSGHVETVDRHWQSAPGPHAHGRRIRSLSSRAWATHHILVARLVSAHPARPAVVKGSGTPYQVSTSGEAGWNTPLIPLVLIEIAVLVALGMTNRRWATILGRDSRWLLLVPIWTALLFALVQSLTNFLRAAA